MSRSLSSCDLHGCENGGASWRPRSPLPESQLHQVQTIAPVELSQVLADCEWVDVALHDCGGPATITAGIVPFCEGVNPFSGATLVAVPAKYAPLLSAAYCSSYVARLRRSDFIAAT